MTGHVAGRTAIAAVEADLVAHVALLHRTAGDDVHDEHGSVWFLTGRDEPHANGILRAALPAEGLSDEVERRLTPFRHRRVPMMWWFFTGLDGVPEAVHAELRRAGLRPTSDLPGMVLDLSAFQAPGLPAGVTIQRVGDAPSFDAWADVVGRAFDDPSFASGGSVQAFRSLGWGEDAPFRHYLARLDGAWVGASTLSRAADVAGLANISAVPDARGRGIGSAVAAAALTDARAMGSAIAVLSAVPVGQPVYGRLGFRTVGRHITYEGRP